MKKITKKHVKRAVIAIASALTAFAASIFFMHLILPLLPSIGFGSTQEIIHVSAGGSHTMAIRNDGSLWACA